MALYVSLRKYTGPIKGGGPERYKKVQEITTKHGGKVHAVYGLLGPWDNMAVVEFPSHEAAMRSSAAVNNLIGTESLTMGAVDRDTFLQILSEL
jgi:uncharacterized protein with GYD domain